MPTVLIAVLIALLLSAAGLGLWLYLRSLRRRRVLDALASQLGLSRRHNETDDALRARMRQALSPPVTGTRAHTLRIAADAAMCSAVDIEIREEPGHVTVVLPEDTSRADEEAARAALEEATPLGVMLSVTRGPR